MPPAARQRPRDLSNVLQPPPVEIGAKRDEDRRHEDSFFGRRKANFTGKKIRTPIAHVRSRGLCLALFDAFLAVSDWPARDRTGRTDRHMVLSRLTWIHSHWQNTCLSDWRGGNLSSMRSRSAPPFLLWTLVGGNSTGGQCS